MDKKTKKTEEYSLTKEELKIYLQSLKCDPEHINVVVENIKSLDFFDDIVRKKIPKCYNHANLKDMESITLLVPKKNLHIYHQLLISKQIQLIMNTLKFAVNNNYGDDAKFSKNKHHLKAACEFSGDIVYKINK